jgi:hypothetical protein
MAGLSPLNVYTSMFLPESMYMFFIGLILLATLRALNQFNWINWFLVGITIAATSLVKPHAWLSAIAIGITLIVVGLGNSKIGIRKTSISIAGLAAGAIVGRIFIGFLVAGPRALGFFGQYLGLQTFDEIGLQSNQSDQSVIVGTSPMNGVVNLFWVQSNIHMLVISALMGLSVVAVIAGVVEILRTRTLTPVTGFALFSLIWLFSLMVEIVIFTGWITGGGDDHTTRVLLRYYEFLFLIVPLAGLSVAASGVLTKTHVWVRWILAAVFAIYITPAFTGFFATLTIQIADAPTLAGLVVNLEVFNAVAIVGFAALVLFAAFPKFTAWAYLLILPVSMAATGWQIQDQYIGFRAQESTADLAGKYLRDNLTDEEIAKTLIIATSRFDATNIAIWADGVNMSYELFVPAAEVPIDLIPQDKNWVIANGDIKLLGEVVSEYKGAGFTLYKVK